MREVALVKTGQLRRWRYTHDSGDGECFVVLDPYTITCAPRTSWTELGWYILIDGRQQWVAEVDIEDDSDVLEDM